MAIDQFVFAYLKTLAEELDKAIGTVETELEGVNVIRHTIPYYVGPQPRPIFVAKYNPEHWEERGLGAPVILDELKTIQGRIEAMVANMQEIGE